MLSNHCLLGRTARDTNAGAQTAVAHLEYEHIDGAEKAIHYMHNVEYCSRTIRVEYRDPAAESKPQASSSASKYALLMAVLD